MIKQSAQEMYTYLLCFQIKLQPENVRRAIFLLISADVYSISWIAVVTVHNWQCYRYVGLQSLHAMDIGGVFVWLIYLRLSMNELPVGIRTYHTTW